jgi:hypothetical protein
MMKKQLLLVSLFLNIFAFATSQNGINNISLQLVNNLNEISSSQRLPTYLTNSFTISAGLSAPVQLVNQPANQISESTPTPTQPPEKKNLAPTRTPRPTTTPVLIPPAANPNATSLMILFGLIAVIVVIVGVWLNRSDK